MYKEGIARFCSEYYLCPKISRKNGDNINLYSHLTNYSLNKYNHLKVNNKSNKKLKFLFSEILELIS